MALLSRKPLHEYTVNFVFCLSRQHRVKFYSHRFTVIINWTQYDPVSQILYPSSRIRRQKRRETLRDLILPFPQHRIISLVPNTNVTRNQAELSDVTTSHHLLQPIYMFHTPASPSAAVLPTPACTPVAFPNARSSFLCLLAGKKWFNKGWVWLWSNQVVHVGSPSSWLNQAPVCQCIS